MAGLIVLGHVMAGWPRRGGGVTEELVQLAEMAAQAVVAAASTDAWAKAKAGLARLLGRGDLARAQAMEGRLEDMRGQLTTVSGAELAARQASAAGAWQARLEDLMEDEPGLAAEMQVLVEQIRVLVPAGAVASGHGLAAGGNVRITASGGGTAAGVIHGSVMPGPTGPGRAS
jgi:hypothetical protein